MLPVSRQVKYLLPYMVEQLVSFLAILCVFLLDVMFDLVPFLLFRIPEIGAISLYIHAND